MAAPGNTVILGVGIIGTATAYYLSQSSRTPAQTIHLVEASPRLFASASGYAGGFLAKDWFSGSVASLGELSFRLHRELAEAHGGREKWGYSASQGVSVAEARSRARVDVWCREGGSRAEAAGKHEFWEGDGPAWLTRRDGQEMHVISEDDSTAQVDPLRLCHFLLSEAVGRGVQLHQPARALSVSRDMRDELAAVRIAKENGEEVDIPCTRLVITAGAWSPQVFSTLFPASKMRLPISSLAGHSLVVESPRWNREHEDKGCHAVFSTDEAGFSPEIFSRIGGEIYIAGLNSSSLALPELAVDAKPDSNSLEQLRTVARKTLGLSSGKDDLQVKREGLCFRPITARGPPLVTRILDAKLGDGMTTRGSGDGGVFLSSGHGPWGISQSLGTGKVLSELVEDQKPSAEIRGLSL